MKSMTQKQTVGAVASQRWILLADSAKAATLHKLEVSAWFLSSPVCHQPDSSMFVLPLDAAHLRLRRWCSLARQLSGSPGGLWLVVISPSTASKERAKLAALELCAPQFLSHDPVPRLFEIQRMHVPEAVGGSLAVRLARFTRSTSSDRAV